MLVKIRIISVLHFVKGQFSKFSITLRSAMLSETYNFLLSQYISQRYRYNPDKNRRYLENKGVLSPFQYLSARDRIGTTRCITFKQYANQRAKLPLVVFPDQKFVQTNMEFLSEKSRMNEPIRFPQRQKGRPVTDVLASLTVSMCKIYG